MADPKAPWAHVPSAPYPALSEKELQSYEAKGRLHGDVARLAIEVRRLQAELAHAQECADEMAQTLAELYRGGDQ